MTELERENKRQHYTKIYSEITQVFNSRDMKEREAAVLARAVMYRLMTLKGVELEKYINYLEGEVKKRFLTNCI